MTINQSGIPVAFLLFVLVTGLVMTISSADYSIGTVIETTGMVHEKFSGNWHSQEDNSTNISGVYTDSEITNGGNFSIYKKIGLTDSTSTSPKFETQKLMQYSSVDGAHLSANELLLSSSDSLSNISSDSICFKDPYNGSSFYAQEQLASTSVTNTKELMFSSGGRYSDGILDYSIQTGEPGNDTIIGLDGTIRTRFEGKTESASDVKTLYDRSLVSGLISKFYRTYHGGDTFEMTGLTSAKGSISEKTVMTEKYISNVSIPGSIVFGTSVYSSDMLTNGGNTSVQKQVTGSDGITAERMITYNSEGDRSIQVSEHAITSRFQLPETGYGNPVCVFAGPTPAPHDSDISSPYKESSAKTGITGVSSAMISSTTVIGNPSVSDMKNLEYRADISIPIGFNKSMVQEMKDTDDDGKFEDLNGNEHLDMHDLVLLFQNFRWIGESNISTRVDFNKNGRADYADIVTIFHAMDNVKKK